MQKQKQKSKQKKVQPEPPKPAQETAQRFFKLIQAGDLAFYNIIKYALVVFGLTKVGKTTLCHNLNKNPLLGYKDDVKEIRYKINTEKDNSAKIGDTTDSQTQIPNQFTTSIIINKDANNPLQIIDTPGLHDSFGLNRILSNAFFHYRVYSKVQNMKLLIVLDNYQTTSPFKKFQITMNNYFKTFKNYEQIEEQLLNATAIVITKATNSKKYQEILGSAVKALVDRKAFNNDKWLEYLKRFYINMTKNKKIFVFTQAQQNKPPGQTSLLQQIHNRTKFFNRKIQFNNQNLVDMSCINFSQANQLKSQNSDETKKQKAKKIFDQLKKKSLNTIKNLITLLRYVQEQTLQSINSPSLGDFSELSSCMNKQSNNIMNLLKDQIKQKYEFIVDKRYNGKRIKIKEEIKQQYKQFQQRHQKLWTNSLSIAFKIFKFITKYQDYQQMNFQFLTTFKGQTQKILKWISLFLNQKNKQIIHKYHYCIHRFFQEIHIMLLVANRSDTFHVDADNPMLNIITIFQTIPNKINQDFLIEMEGNPKFSYALKDLNNFFVNFLEKNGNLIIQSKLKEVQIIKFTSQFQLSQKCKMSLTLMKFNKIQREFEKLSFKQSQQKLIIMTNTLIQYVNQLKENRKLMKFKDYQDLKQRFTQIQISVWTMLGSILLKHSNIKPTNFNQHQRVLAIIEIHKLVFNTGQVINLYQSNIKRLEKQNIKEFTYNSKDKHSEDQQVQIFISKRNQNNQFIVQERISFAQYLNSIGRSSHALIILQEAYSLIKKNPEQRKIISEMIALIGLGKDKPIAQGSQKYYSKLANKEFVSNPSKNLLKYLQQLKNQHLQQFGTIFDQRHSINQLHRVPSPRKGNSNSNNSIQVQAPQVPQARNSI